MIFNFCVIQRVTWKDLCFKSNILPNSVLVEQKLLLPNVFCLFMLYTGAVVKLACNNTKYHLTSLGTTDKNGYFFIQPKWLTTAGYHKCKVFLAKSPKAECSVPTNFHNGQSGAMLIPAPPSPMISPKPEPEVKLFNVGPFAFEPSKNLPCKTVWERYWVVIV